MEMMVNGDLVGLRRQLQDNPALLSMTDDDGNSLLVSAVRQDNAEAVKLLVSADLEAVLIQNNRGQTPLHYAKSDKIATYLLHGIEFTAGVPLINLQQLANQLQRWR